MNSVAYNWSFAAEFFYGELWNLWLLVDEIQVEKYVNSQLKVNGIGIAKFQPRNAVSWLHFSGRLVKIRGYIYRVWSWLKILLI